jgi:pyrroline-5-carboxylate reductase
MGGALIAGWRNTQTYDASDFIVRDPAPGREALFARDEGARLNPPLKSLSEARVVVLATKPQAWRSAVSKIAPFLDPDAMVISIIAGVETADLAEVMGGRPVARVMPNTAAAIGAGAASVFSTDSDLYDLAHLLFEPLGTVVDVAEESLMHAVTALSGSGPAYLYALVEALEAAGVEAGLDVSASARLSRATIIGAAALLAQGEDSAGDLRRQVTSPGGTTEAALEVLTGPGGLPDLLTRAVCAAVERSAKLAAS